MSDAANGNSRKPPEQISRQVKNSRLAKFEGIIVSRERIFDVVATIITAIFTVVLALSTVLLWKETKDLRNFAEQQSEDMKASIAEAARSADAMRDVAKAVAANAEAANDTLALYKNANIRQNRAYLMVELGGVVAQNKETNYRFEVRMTLQNVGNTPAYNVRSNIHADLLPIPLPNDFQFPAFVPKISGTSTMGPHQSNFFTAIANRIYSDDEIHEMEFGPNKQLYVYGTITYEGAFGISRKTNFCQQVLWIKGGGFMSYNVGKYNEAD
jgi:hypothetical protein